MQVSRQQIWNHLDSLTKPPRSLGRLEELAARLCEVQQTLSPETTPRKLVLFAGDHGVVAAGVSAWPSQVTGQMVRNICAGRAASTVLARETRTDAILIDVGTLGGDGADEQRSDGPATGCQFRQRRVRAGTRDLSREPALSVGEFEAALEIGRDEARAAARDGMRVVAAGEMGIGNTTPSACLAMLLADVPIQAAVGRGAGADEDTLNRKREIVEGAVARARHWAASDSVAAMAAVGGLEIAAMAGFFMAAHEAALTVVLDGYIASAAALIAERLQPGTSRSMIASHVSAEPGHRNVLEHLGLSPFLDWKMRLGEGTGAILLMPLLDAAAAITCHMATFQDVGIAAKALHERS
jgi:nicotinate-nucleotide--dimethylbenzimidazole phosphoribosyltransferase